MSRYRIVAPTAALTFAAVLPLLLIASPAARAQTAADPNLYVAEYFQENIFRVAPDGTGKTTFTAPLGTGNRFDQMAFAPSGNLYVTTNNGGNIIHTFSPTGSFLGNLITSNSGADGIAIDSSGNIYASGGSSVGKYTASGAFLYTLTAGINGAYSLALDTSSNLYVANYGSGTVRKFSSTGTDLGVFASGLGTTEGVAVDPFGNVYVSSRSLNNLQEFNAAGSLLNTYTGFNDPLGVASDNVGNIYVASYSHGASGSGFISKILSSGQNLGKIVSGGNPDGLAFRVPLAGGAAAPEPSSLLLLILPVVGTVVARRRKIN